MDPRSVLIAATAGSRAGVVRVTPRCSTEAGDDGGNDATSLEKAVTAVARVTSVIR